MSDDRTIKLGDGELQLTGGEARPSESGVEVVGKPKSADGALVDMVTEATWNDALSQLGGLPSNPLPLWSMLATRILRAVADGERDPLRIKRFALDGLNDHGGFDKWR